MSHTKLKQNYRLEIKIKYLILPDSGPRLSRAIDILLEAAARKATLQQGKAGIKKEEPFDQTSAEPVEAGGDEIGHSDDEQG